MDLVSCSINGAGLYNEVFLWILLSDFGVAKSESFHKYQDPSLTDFPTLMELNAKRLDIPLP